MSTASVAIGLSVVVTPELAPSDVAGASEGAAEVASPVVVTPSEVAIGDSLLVGAALSLGLCGGPPELL